MIRIISAFPAAPGRWYTIPNPLSAVRGVQPAGTATVVPPGVVTNVPAPGGVGVKQTPCWRQKIEISFDAGDVCPVESAVARVAVVWVDPLDL
jgi:hypothetical protein